MSDRVGAGTALVGNFGYEDYRGVIQDIFGPGTTNGPIDAVTHITTVKGMVRGNHYHERTTQWTLILEGRLLMAMGSSQVEVGPGVITKHSPGEPHAWKALEATACLVFTQGPRSGDQYESDTFRLEEPLIA